MKCIKCKTVNVHNANYCKKCAYHFSEIEQEAAEKRTFIGFLKKIEKIKKNIFLNKITEHIAFKVGSVVGVLCIGISFMLTNGTTFKIEESDNYTGNYNDKLDEYYLYSSEDETKLNLYIPKRVENLEVKHYDKDNNVLTEDSYKVTDNIVLDSNSNDDYYILEAKYNDKDTDKIKLFIYQVKDGE